MSVSVRVRTRARIGSARTCSVSVRISVRAHLAHVQLISEHVAQQLGDGPVCVYVTIFLRLLSPVSCSCLILVLCDQVGLGWVRVRVGGVTMSWRGKV